MERKRLKHPKVRTGCITCKIRHKKCDEAIPACGNCTSTGRKCDGYAQVPDKRTRSWRQPADTGSQCAYQPHIIGIPGQGLSWKERWHLDYFRRCTTVQCAEYFEDAFWGRLVLQMCEGQAAVQHAAIAMSARQCQFEEVQTKQVEDRESFLALSHSHKSITCLGADLVRHDSNRAHKETVLVSCIILTMLALFQQDLFTARCHLRSGYNLFKEWAAIDTKPSPNKEIIEQAFSQVQIHYSTCVNPREFLNNHRLLPPRPPQSDKAATCDADLVRESRGLLVIGRQIVQSHPGGGFSISRASSPLHRGGVAVLSKLRLWRSQLKFFESSRLHSQRHRDMLAVLELWTLIIDVKMSVADSQEPGEALYDDYLTYFQRAVLLARELLRPDVSEVPAPVCYIRPSVVTALLWCGVKCRDWKTRNDIMALLRGCNHHSPWVSAATTSIGGLIQIERHGIAQGAPIPAAARVDCVSVSPLLDSFEVQLWYQRFQLGSCRDEHAWESVTMPCQ
ncbi:unnamed protein product [Penicillium salamii]|nr:unnamed protein product [Penicillium salamii]CAG8428015.1 unnamed protein product [Penicillium salamii]